MVSLCRIEIFVLFTRAIEIRVIEQASNITEVKNCEVKFTKVLTHTSTTTDNLLELGHRADIRIQNNVFDRLNIYASRQQLGGCNQHRVLAFYVTEIIKLIYTGFIVGCDSHNIAFIDSHHVGVLVYQSPTHSVCVFLINTEEYGLIHSAIMLLQIIRDCLCNQLGTLFKNDISIKIQRIVNPVINHFAVVIRLSGVGNESFDIFVKEYTDNTIRSEVAIVDALFQSVGVDGISKVVDIGNFLGFFWCCRKTYLRCGREVFQNLTPLAISFCTATVTLIHHNQIEERGAELLKQAVGVFVFTC